MSKLDAYIYTMVDIKNLINSVICDLGDDKPISSILLRTQIIAAQLKDEDFTQWIYNEQHGYPDTENLPSYRVLGAIVKADISIPYRGIYTNLTIPVDTIKEDTIRECISHVWITQSLTEIENMCKNNTTGILSAPLPAFGYTEVEQFVNGHVERAYQQFNVASAMNILHLFKSKLLDFFLELDNKIETGIDFSKIASEQLMNKIMNTTYNINAAVANTGNGNVTTENVNASNFQQIVNAEQKDELQNIIAQIEAIAKEHNLPEILDYTNNMKSEIEKPESKKSFLKMALNAIKGVATGIVANQLTPLVTQALALL